MTSRVDRFGRRRVSALGILVTLLAACETGCSSSGGNASSQSGVSPTCGNNVVDDPNEACDGTAMPTQVTCAFATQNPTMQGYVGCNASCKLDTSTCIPGPGGGGTIGTGGFISASGGYISANGGTIGQGGIVTGAGGVVGAGGTIFGAGGAGNGGIVGGGGIVGNGGDNGSGGAIGTGGSINTAGEPKIPPTPSDCPTLRTGNITVLGQQVALQVGQKQTNVKGSVMFYWHGTGSSAAEVSLLGPAAQEIVSQGGIVASFSTSLATGQSTGNNVWYVDDFKMTDYILGCAVAQLNIDTHRIYTAGCSAGGLQAGAMVYARSSYLAAAMPNSGGSLLSQLEDPTHTPSLITAHGSCSDMVIIYFANMSRAECNNVVQQHGIAVDCDHGGGHCGDPAPLVAAQWQFCKDHPFGVNPDPYANGFPASVPAFAQYCKQYPDPNQPKDCP